MTPEQKLLQARRLHLEEMIWTAEKLFADLKQECKEHLIIKGRTMFSPAKNKVVNTMDGLPDNWNDGSYSVSCAICGKDFGWACPVNPKGYCEYDHPNWASCKHCGIPEERK